MKSQNRSVILVKRRKAKHPSGHHGGSWKIAYADFMTAMMAFFLVMWLLSVSTPQERLQIADYFRTPLKVTLTGGDQNSSSTSVIPGGGDDPTQQRGEVHKHIESDANRQDRQEQRQLNQLREKLNQLIELNPKLKALKPHLVIDMMDEGLRIQIIDSHDRPMFRTGSARVEPYMRDILRAIAPIINEFPNKISLSGHTDDVPYAGGEHGYSNWELSADRANSSRRELLAGGLEHTKVLRVVGMASTMRLKDIAPDDPVNRRISILVLNKQAQHNIERENQGHGTLDIESAESLKQLDTGDSVPAATPPTEQPATAVQAPQSSTGTITSGASGPTTSLPAAPASNAPVSPTSRDAQ